MSSIPIARVPRRTIALVAALLVLGVPAAAHGGGTTEPPLGTDADFCLDTPPGVPVNEYNCPITTTSISTSTSTVPRPPTTTPRVKASPRYTG